MNCVRFFVISVLSLAFAMPSHARYRGADGAADVVRFAPYAAVFVMKAAGVEGRSDWKGVTINAALSAALSCGTTFALKYAVGEKRPDGSDNVSFPSGHATVAFAGAAMLHKEYGHVSPWISITGYSAATLVAASRVAADHHYWHDVAAGAAIGWLGTELTYRLTERLFPKKNVNVAFAGTSLDLTWRF